MPNQRASFRGTLKADRIEGTFHQGADVPLTLTRTPIKLARPQIPLRPYPYDDEEVTFEGLSGTLTIPRGKGPFPAVVLITGSGPQTRDQEVAGHPIFLVLAHHLTSNGIAVLRYDDRGIGKSKGDFSKATALDFALDAASAFDFLRKHPKVAPKKSGLLGHSEGGIVAPIVQRDVAFYVLLAPSAVPGREVILAQKEAILKAMGVAKPDLSADGAVYEALLAGKEEAVIAEVAKPMLAGMPESAKANQLRFLTSPWFRSFLKYDPAPSLQKIDRPALLLFGANDLQVLPSQNMPAAKAFGNKHLTIEELPNLNHLFQTSKTGSPSEYASIEETISPVALKRISDWILAR